MINGKKASNMNNPGDAATIFQAVAAPDQLAVLSTSVVALKLMGTPVEEFRRDAQLINSDR